MDLLMAVMTSVAASATLFSVVARLLSWVRQRRTPEVTPERLQRFLREIPQSKEPEALRRDVQEFLARAIGQSWDTGWNPDMRARLVDMAVRYALVAREERSASDAASKAGGQLAHFLGEAVRSNKTILQPK